MHIKDLEILHNLRDFFGLGTVRTDKSGAHYQVTGINNLLKYSLVIFTIILGMLAKKEHLNNSGFLRALSYINCLNKPIIKTIGPIPFLPLPPIPVIKTLPLLNPYWIIGFIMGASDRIFYLC